MRRTSLAFLRTSLGLVLPTALVTGCPDDTGVDSDASSSTGEETSDTVDPDTTLTTSMTDPDTSATDPDTSATDPDTSATDPDTSATDPDTSATDPDTSATGSESSTTDAESSTTEDPETTGGVCGDDVVDGGEACDGIDLDDENCMSQGYDGGVLACDDECNFDISGCVMFSCGNDVQEGAEVCDGDDLTGEDCTSLGFGSGTLACADNCLAFDTSACAAPEDCNNDVDDDGDGDVDCADTECLGVQDCAAIEFIVDCDPEFCVLAADAGPNGGDLCTCTIPAAQHPIVDDAPDAGCFLSTPGTDLLMQFTTAPVAFSVSTCNIAPGDSAVAAYDGDPTGMPAVLGCNEDASMEMNFCSEIGNNPAGEALLTSTLGATELWLQVDEYVLGDYWDLATDRVIEVELVDVVPAEVCDDGLDNDFDGDVDCSDADCAADPGCQGNAETLTDCDPTYCTFAADAGPNGGDLCTCVIPAADHPTLDDLDDASCFGFNPGIELVWSYTTTGYDGYSATTCTADQGDSSLATYDGDPDAGGVELQCDEDAVAQAAFCSEIVDSGGAGPGLPTALPVSDDLYLVIDEWGPGDYWDGTTQRTFQIELLVGAPELCGDGVDNDFDGLLDCADDACNGAPQCGGPVEELDGCDATFCTFSAGTGPNGGDVCSCTIAGASHPVGDDLPDATCFGNVASGRELLWSYDAAAYANYVVSTCSANQGDSSVATYDDDPGAGGVQLACDEDAVSETAFCSEITDSGNAAAGLPTPVPGTGEVWVLIDEWNLGSYWNGASARTFEIELLP